MRLIQYESIFMYFKPPAFGKSVLKIPLPISLAPHYCDKTRHILVSVLVRRELISIFSLLFFVQNNVILDTTR